ncbi:MAG: hypothetical protein LC667_02115, partial [Thioalkalivibrio sp.]|nr:hypothetical protein [Thioalkalivibrio sp.]
MRQPRSVLWGDLHRQTELTCGAGDFEDHLAAAVRDGLDFLAVTDNAVLTEDPRLRQFVGTELARHPHFFPALEAHSISRDEWDALRRFAHESEARTPFFFLGYEWCSNRYGDRNVYYEDDGPLHRPSELSDLHPTLKRFGALAVLHHTGYARGRRGADWNHHDGTTERLVEIFSTQHGSSEGLGSERPLHSRSMGGLTAEGSVNAALARRYKLGFTGGTDLHALEQTPGRTGALVERDDRAAVWDALWNRRTLATTGRSFVFDVAVDGHGIGSILTTDRLPTVRASLPSDGWERAELVRNGTVAAAWARTDVRAEDGVVPLEFRERAAD